MNEQYDDFDRALLRAGKKASAPTSRMRARALSAAAAVGATGAATAATTKAAAATKMTALAKATKVILAAKWTMIAAVTTASVGTAVYVAETRSAKTEHVPAVVAAPPIVAARPKVEAKPEPKEEAPPAPALEEPIAPPAPKPAVAVVVKPAAVTTAAKTTVDPLREELGLVEDARRALAMGDSSAALGKVDEHARRFPSGAFVVERDVIRIDALAAAGRRDEASARARDFLASHPGSAQARRIAKMTETNP